MEDNHAVRDLEKKALLDSENISYNPDMSYTRESLT
jgi:hypothetical protein